MVRSTVRRAAAFAATGALALVAGAGPALAAEHTPAPVTVAAASPNGPSTVQSPAGPPWCPPHHYYHQGLLSGLLEGLGDLLGGLL